MNFLAHLWLADAARLPLAGAILGDTLHGALPADLPEPLARSVRLHRRIDAVTDRHPRVQAARRRFEPGTRRYAGIVIDVLFDHVLALEWPAYSGEPLPAFIARAAAAVAAEGRWFAHAGQPPPRSAPFAALLESYGAEAGIEHALRRTATRLRRPQGLIEAMAGWRGHLPQLRGDLPVVLADLRAASNENQTPWPAARQDAAPTKVY
jgi:acyl carrier protein phosphodiesterase